MARAHGFVLGMCGLLAAGAIIGTSLTGYADAPEKPMNAKAKRGSAIFQQNCVSCHNKQGGRHHSFWSSKSTRDFQQQADGESAGHTGQSYRHHQEGHCPHAGLRQHPHGCPDQRLDCLSEGAVAAQGTPNRHCPAANGSRFLLPTTPVTLPTGICHLMVPPRWRTSKHSTLTWPRVSHDATAISRDRSKLTAG